MKPRGRLKAYITLPVWLTILFAALAVWVCFLNRMAGLLCVIFVAVYFVIVLLVYRRSSRYVTNEMVDFAMRYGTVQRKILNEFEIPFAILDQSARFLWMNQKFCELTGKDKHSNASIASIFPAITKDKIAASEQLDLQVTKDENVYRASVRKVAFPEMADDNLELESPDQTITLIYLFDETLTEQYEKKQQDMQMVPALVYIDNYDEVMETLEEVDQSQLLALVDQTVNPYFATRGGIVKKTEEDKYFVVFPHKYLDEMTETGFALLEDVQNLQAYGGEMTGTLSIGIGAGSTEYMNN